MKLCKYHLLLDHPKKKFNALKFFFTTDEVLQHSKCNFNAGDIDLWLVINNTVYDVTNWVPNHPGGGMICIAAGYDATFTFENFHGVWVRKSLPPWCIGYLKEGDKMPIKVKKEKAN